MTSPTGSHPTDLPATIRSYLATHAARDVAAAVQAFSPDAVVIHQGQIFRGTDEVLDFLRNAGAEFDFTTELVDANRNHRARVRCTTPFAAGRTPDQPMPDHPTRAGDHDPVDHRAR